MALGFAYSLGRDDEAEATTLEAEVSDAAGTLATGACTINVNR